jgi:spore coat polysaccharide biosynthesis protein SpsF (cytidylyltransferase family)
VAVFVPVRLESTRLPGKALLDLAGRHAIEHLIDRVKLAKLPSLIVLCTTTRQADDPLQRLATEDGIHCFRGSETDLLDRYLQAAMAHHVDLIVNVDGDDILVDPEFVDQTAELLLRTDADFAQYAGLPLGATPVGLRIHALRRVCESKTETDTATGWSKYFTDSSSFKVQILRTEDKELQRSEIRLTLDYPEDYAFFQEVFRYLYVSGAPPFRLREVLRLLGEKPEIVRINSNLEKRYWEHFSQSSPQRFRNASRPVD